MRSILVGVVVAVVAVGGTAYGGDVVDDMERRPEAAVDVIETVPETEERTVIHQSAPFREVVVEEYHSAGAEMGMGVASTILSVFYTPVRLAVGVVGAGLGGVEGWLTGGDLRTARSMWRPTVEGDYFIRPDHLDKTERYEWSNVRPVVRERYTLRGREPVVLQETERVVVTDADANAIADGTPVEPEIEDDSADDR
jgi:hypothetical protein